MRLPSFKPFRKGSADQDERVFAEARNLARLRLEQYLTAPGIGPQPMEGTTDSEQVPAIAESPSLFNVLPR